MPQPDPVDRIADAARVSEPGLAHPPLDIFAERVVRFGAEPVAFLLHHELADAHELIGGEVGKVDVVGDPGRHAGIRTEERVHSIPVTGQDHDEVVPLGLHDLEQDLDGLLTVVTLVACPVEVVGLVDEEHAAHGPLDDTLCLRRRVPYILPNQVVARHADQMPPAQVTEPFEQLGHAHGHRCLARPWAAGEAHVKGGARRTEAVTVAQLVDKQQGGDLPDACLDWDEADKLVQPVEDAGDRKSTRLNSSHVRISYAVFCLQKKKKKNKSETKNVQTADEALEATKGNFT